MREPKFRAWSNDHNRYCDFVTLDESGRWIGWIKSNGVYLTTTDIVIEQYTGLKDKNGKEIYRGDVVSGHSSYHTSYHIETFEIAWREDRAGWFGFAADDYTSPLCSIGHAEVIGNVHENHELLEEKE